MLQEPTHQRWYFRPGVGRIVVLAWLGLTAPWLVSCSSGGDGSGSDVDPEPPPGATPNEPPVAVDDAASTSHGQSVVIHVLANDTDADGDGLALMSVGAAVNGTTTAQTDGSVSYAPDNGFEGSDSFTYTVSDGQGGTGTGSVSIMVAPAPEPPAASLLNERIAAALEGSWLKVNENRFEEVWTPVAQRARVDGVPFGEPRKIITAWSSMAWDSNRDQLVLWGGGHANYAGNEVYRFDAADLRWHRASLPSAVIDPFADRRYFAVDGAANAPISAHTYDNQEFLPLIDRFVTFGGASYDTGAYFLLDDGQTITGPYLWDPSRADPAMVGGTTGSHVDPTAFPDVTGGRMWMNRNAVAINGVGASRPNAFVNGTSAYDAGQGQESLLVSESPQFGGDLFRYRIEDVGDPSLDRWELIGPGLRSYSNQGAGAFDPERQLYLRTAKMDSSYGIVMWNVATPGASNAPINFVPAGGSFVLTNLHGMDFDARRSLFVLWSGDGNVWYLRPPASGPAFAPTGWTVEAAPVSGTSAPAVTGTTGVLGKWKYLASYDVMLGLGHGTEGQVWIYKPVGWQPP
jgi:hypothetical protein